MNAKEFVRLEFLGFVDFGYIHETLWRLHQAFGGYVKGSLIVGSSLLDAGVKLPEPQNIAHQCPLSREAFQQLYEGETFEFQVKGAA